MFGFLKDREKAGYVHKELTQKQKKIIKRIAIFAAVIMMAGASVVTGSMLLDEDRRFPDSNRMLFLYDFNFFMNELEESFPFIDLLYRAHGICLHQLADNTRYAILNSPMDMEAIDLFRILNNYFFGQGGLSQYIDYGDRDFFAQGAARIGHLYLVTTANVNRYSNVRGNFSRARQHAELFGGNGRRFYLEIAEIRRIRAQGEIYVASPLIDDITMEVVVPDQVALIHVSRMRGLWSGRTAPVREAINEFYSEIADFEHLIIDLRGNRGGFSGPQTVFESLVLGPLIPLNNPRLDEPGGFLGMNVILPHYFDRYLSITAYQFIMNSERNHHFADMPLPHGLTEVELENLYLPYINVSDLAQFDRAFRADRVVRSQSGLDVSVRNSKKWVLIDEHTASAGEGYVAIMKYSGFATVVGENTFGIPSSIIRDGFGFFRGYISLPNSGIAVQYDFGYLTDPCGNAWEGYGITPHYFNRPGMDALETVLAMIAEMDE